MGIERDRKEGTEEGGRGEMRKRERRYTVMSRKEENKNILGWF